LCVDAITRQDLGRLVRVIGDDYDGFRVFTHESAKQGITLPGDTEVEAALQLMEGLEIRGVDLVLELTPRYRVSRTELDQILDPNFINLNPDDPVAKRYLERHSGSLPTGDILGLTWRDFVAALFDYSQYKSKSETSESPNRLTSHLKYVIKPNGMDPIHFGEVLPDVCEPFDSTELKEAVLTRISELRRSMPYTPFGFARKGALYIPLASDRSVANGCRTELYRMR